MTRYIILGGCLGGVVLIIAIILLVCCCVKRKQNKPRQVKYILKPDQYDHSTKPDNNNARLIQVSNKTITSALGSGVIPRICTDSLNYLFV